MLLAASRFSGASFALRFSRGSETRPGGSKGFANFARELGDDELVRGAKKRGELGRGESVTRLQSNPFRAGEIRRGDNAGALSEFNKVFRGDLERQADRCRDERSDGEHLATDLEEKVVAPLNLLGSSRKGEADFAELLDVHSVVRSTGRLGWPPVADNSTWKRTPLNENGTNAILDRYENAREAGARGIILR